MKLIELSFFNYSYRCRMLQETFVAAAVSAGPAAPDCSACWLAGHDNTDTSGLASIVHLSIRISFGQMGPLWVSYRWCPMPLWLSLIPAISTMRGGLKNALLCLSRRKDHPQLTHITRNLAGCRERWGEDIFAAKWSDLEAGGCPEVPTALFNRTKEAAPGCFSQGTRQGFW